MTRRYTGGFLSAKEQATDANTASGIFTAHEAGALTAAGNFPTGNWIPSRSLRFRSSVGAYLNKSYGSDGNRKTWTMSWWIKRGKISSDQHLWSSAGVNHPGGADIAYIGFTGDDRFVTFMYPNGGPATYYVGTNRLFRDPSAWYHIVLHMDTTQAISTNRIKIYVNGVQETSLQNTSYPSLDYASSYINSTRPQIIGHEDGRWRYAFDGHMAEFHFIDGQALDATNFGSTNPSTGTWIPKRYTGTYGTNGFYLDFRDNSSTTNIALDRSGNSNNFTTNNISVTAGATNDSLVDVPGITSVSSQNDVGGVQRGNYCTWNPAFFAAGVTYSDANLTAFSSTNSVKNTVGTIAVDTGKWYFEETIAAQSDAYRAYLGFVQPINVPDGFYLNDVPGFAATWNVGNTSVTYGTQSVLKSSSTGGFEFTTATISDTKSVGDVYMFAYDGTSGKIWFGKNGTWFSSGSPSTGANPAGTLNTQFSYTPACNLNVTGAGNSVTLNCGQRPFAYTPPVGFKSLNTTNLPNPVIKRSNDHFDVKTYTGNGSNLIVGTTQKQTSAYAINKSLKFRKANSAYLSRTPSTTGNQKTWTWSGWVKQSLFGTSGTQWLLTSGNSGSIATNYTMLSFSVNGFAGNTNQLQFYSTLANSTVCALASSQTFGDSTEWSNVVIAVDTTQVSETNRVKLYVDGVQITSFATGTYPSLNADIPFINSSSFETRIGGIVTYGSFDGYMAEVNFVDGQSLTPASFGAFDANNNWVPQRYAGTYGTNGYYLPMNTTASGFSGYYGEFNLTSTAQYISVPDSTAIQFQTGNFTQECYFYLKGPNPGSAAYYSLWGSYNDATAVGQYLHIDDAGRLTWGTNGAIYITTVGAVPKYQWNHVALVRSTSSLVTLYLNGKNVGSMNSGTGDLVTGAAFRIGSLNNTFPRYFPGLISNFRYTKSAVYTAEFVPPTGTLTAIANTQLLLLTGASATTDGSTNNMTVTNVGTVTTKAGNVGAYTSIGNDASGNIDHWDLVAINPQPAAVRFTTVGTTTWTAPPGVTSVNYLVVAGGGGGGTDHGGGGGAGGLLQGKLDVTPGTSYTVTVGAGGAGAAYSLNTSVNGSNSVFSSITSTGGGGGGGQYVAQNGGSGGGARPYTPYNVVGTGISGQGNNGGSSSSNETTHREGGGGGGAGAVGGNSNVSTGAAGAGGVGLVSFITGSSVFYAGGGGGGCSVGFSPGSGGSGGGAAGITGSGTGNPATANTGGGGGGGGGVASSPGGIGGSGIVILSYGAGNDSTYDSPTNNIDNVLGNGGGTGNTAVLDSNNKNSNHTISNAGLTITSSSYGAAAATLGVSSGKWYYEATISNRSANNSGGIGWCNELYAVTTQTYLTDTANSFGINAINGNAAYNTANTAHGSAFSSGDVIMCALDVDAKKAYFGKNGTWFSNSNPVTGASTFPYTFTGNTFYPAVNAFGDTYQFNFGQQNFIYTPPTGFKAINTKNLKDVGSFNLPDSFGNFVNTPDLVWTKSRSQATSLYVYDSVRGAGNRLVTNTTLAQAAISGVTSFIPNGFTLGTETGNNNAGDSYVGWAWNRGRTPGFDIVNYGGRGAGTTFEHNLGVEPSFVIMKCTSTTGNWITYHKSLTRDKYLYVNSTGGEQSQTNAWIPTSNSFSITQDWSDAATSGRSFVAYLWAEVPGFSKFGRYTGNNATNGPFIYTGFRPRFVMIKRTDTTGNWSITDTAINPFNIVLTPALRPNTTDSESTVGTVYVQPLSNGFKITNNNSDTNASGQYVYAAYAENPFKYGNAR
jgi:hypothetical protein